MTTATLRPTSTPLAPLPASPARSVAGVRPLAVRDLVRTPDGFIARVKALPWCSGEPCAYVQRLGGYPKTYAVRELERV